MWFIDCTDIEISISGDPGFKQGDLYSVHKLFHCLICQTVTTPDGLILHMFGPKASRRHDLKLFRQSGMDNIWHYFLNMEGK